MLLRLTNPALDEFPVAGRVRLMKCCGQWRLCRASDNLPDGFGCRWRFQAVSEDVAHMLTLFIAVGTFIGYLIAYHTYGRWVSRKIFQLDPNANVPSHELRDNVDFVPTKL